MCEAVLFDQEKIFEVAVIGAAFSPKDYQSSLKGCERKDRLRKPTSGYNRKMKIQLKIISFLSIFFDDRH